LFMYVGGVESLRYFLFMGEVRLTTYYIGGIKKAGDAFLPG